MSISLEFTGDYNPVQRNFDKLAAAVVDAGDQSASIRFGTGTATITDGTRAASGNIAHGLGRTPAIVIAMANETADTRDDYVVTGQSADATNLVFNVRGAAAESFPITNPT